MLRHFVSKQTLSDCFGVLNIYLVISKELLKKERMNLIIISFPSMQITVIKMLIFRYFLGSTLNKM